MSVLFNVLFLTIFITVLSEALRTPNIILKTINHNSNKSNNKLNMITQHYSDVFHYNQLNNNTIINNNINFKPVIIGIAGGSASGKTTFANSIMESLGSDDAVIISHDSYYKELDTSLTIKQKSLTNFDHPDSLDTDLLIEHLYLLKNGKSINIPIYNYTTHSRSDNSILINPSRVIIVDGILIFSEPRLLELMDMKIFVDTDDDIRLIRRIQRDIDERGRSVDSVIEQYQRTVRPMHQLYVEPSKRGADIIVPASSDGSPPTVALEMCVSRLREIINYYQ